MSRSAKTNHVMSLVGKENKTEAKSDRKPFVNKLSGAAAETGIKNPALQAIISEQEQELRSKAKGNSPSEENISSQVLNVPNAETVDRPQRGSKITAIVPELINEELETVVNRFKIDPDDGNLWNLTRAALEAVRPEYSHSPEEYSEKCDRLRQKVILEMTKAAIRLSKDKSHP